MRILPRLMRVVAVLGLVGGVSAQALPPLASAQGLAPAHVAAISAAPTLGSPANGTRFQSISAITLNWNLPSGSTQYQIQLSPFNNDGPGINLIRDAATTYTIDPPVLGQGPYVILPGMTYTWRVRSSSAAGSLGEADSGWSRWTSRTFTTPAPLTSTLRAVSPESGGTVAGLTPTLVWDNSQRHVFYYEVQVSKDRSFGSDAFLYWELRHGGATTPLNSYTIGRGFPLEAATTYYWRVRPRVQGDGKPVDWPAARTFKTP